MMNELNPTFTARAAELVSVGRFFFERGWVPATAGNLSARLDDYHMAITVSGRHKGELTGDDLMVMDLEGNVVSEGKQPSAEAFLHTIMYRRSPRTGAVLHTHSVNATVLSRLSPDGLALEDYEVLKALPGFDTHEAALRVPVFANDQDIRRLAARVDDLLNREPDIPGYLIEGHGLYTWGTGVQAARRHMEAFEFLFECEVLTRRLRT
jgi:methylthioribulose-1-phosphate dehydratase